MDEHGADRDRLAPVPRTIGLDRPAWGATEAEPRRVVVPGAAVRTPKEETGRALSHVG